MVTLAVPMAMLVATLMAFGSFASYNEITIMKSCGISLTKLMTPVLLIALILSYLMIRFNNDVLPEANHQARVLLQDISMTKPTFILEPGKFSDDIGGARILVRKTFENSNKLEGIYIYDNANPFQKNMITADSGDIGFTDDLKNIVMNLHRGEIHQYSINDPQNKYRRITFQKHRIILSAAGFGLQHSSDNAFMRGDRELSAHDLNAKVDSINSMRETSRKAIIDNTIYNIKKLFSYKLKDTVYKMVREPDSLSRLNPVVSKFNNAEIDSIYNLSKIFCNFGNQLKSQTELIRQIEKQVDVYDVEVYKKYSIPFACFIFALIGAPLGYRVKRGGFGVAAGLSLLFFLLYWIALIGGEKLADRAIISPFIAMWGVNFVMGGFGLYLMFKSS
jgi:lipopolysaccharide export system permease protein